MPATPQEAVDDILSTFKTAWDAQDDAPEVIYPSDELRTFFDGDDPWASLTYAHTLRQPATVSAPAGQRRYKALGTVEVQINVPLSNDDVLTVSQELARVVTDAFENVQTTHGVVFFDVTAQEIGRTGRWFLTSVTMRFRYTEIR